MNLSIIKCLITGLVVIITTGCNVSNTELSDTENTIPISYIYGNSFTYTGDEIPLLQTRGNGDISITTKINSIFFKHFSFSVIFSHHFTDCFSFYYWRHI